MSAVLVKPRERETDVGRFGKQLRPKGRERERVVK